MWCHFWFWAQWGREWEVWFYFKGNDHSGKSHCKRSGKGKKEDRGNVDCNSRCPSASQRRNGERYLRFHPQKVGLEVYPLRERRILPSHHHVRRRGTRFRGFNLDAGDWGGARWSRYGGNWSFDIGISWWDPVNPSFRIHLVSSRWILSF